MKKGFLSMALVLILGSGLFSAVVYAEQVISVIVDGEQVDFSDQKPVIISGRTLVPIRSVFETMGFDVDWNNDSRQAIITNLFDEIIITLDSTTFTTNGVNYTLDVPAQSIGGRILVPLRGILESVGCHLDWNDETSTVIVSSRLIELEDTTLAQHQLGADDDRPYFVLEGERIYFDDPRVIGVDPVKSAPVVTEAPKAEPAKVEKESKPSPTEEEVLEAMLALEKDYPTGTKWDRSNKYLKRGGCSGFALMLQDAAFDDIFALARQHKDFDNIRVGDTVYYATHVVVVIGVDDEKITVAEGNINGKVMWGREISIEFLKQNARLVETMYSE